MQMLKAEWKETLLYSCFTFNSYTLTMLPVVLFVISSHYLHTIFLSLSFVESLIVAALPDFTRYTHWCMQHRIRMKKEIAKNKAKNIPKKKWTDEFNNHNSERVSVSVSDKYRILGKFFSSLHFQTTKSFVCISFLIFIRYFTVKYDDSLSFDILHRNICRLFGKIAPEKKTHTHKQHTPKI